jgi:hypothetical protein
MLSRLERLRGAKRVRHRSCRPGFKSSLKMTDLESTFFGSAVVDAPGDHIPTTIDICEVASEDWSGRCQRQLEGERLEIHIFFQR